MILAKILTADLIVTTILINYLLAINLQIIFNSKYKNQNEV